MIQVWIFVLMTFSFTALASEFTHIKLNPQFEEYLTQTPSKSNLLSAKKKSLQGQSFDQAVPDSASIMQTRMVSALLGITNPIPVDGEGSPLYEELRRHLENAHDALGREQVLNINRLNQQFNFGSSNFSGFSWQKPFGVVQVYVDRQVTPNLFGTNYLIQDAFHIDMEATTFIEKLNESGLANMSAAEVAAFAGITFQRVYTYYHYANSYQEGLQADFGKLFLSFLKFNQKGMEAMANEEILKRDDTWTARAGGLISTPPLYNISFSAGALAQYDYHQMTSLQSNHTTDSNLQRYKVGVLSKSTTNIGVTAELQLDFFRLIKLSLLRYDLNYEYATGKEFTLGFNQNNWEQVKSDPEKVGEFRQLLRGQGTVKKLEPYVVRLDESKEEGLQTRGSILIFGKLKKSKTEQIRVIKDQNVRVFFKSYAQSVKVVQNILSRIFSAIIYKFLKFPVGATNAAIYSRQLTMEYDATHPQASDPTIQRLQNKEDFSFVLTQYYDAARTDRWLDRRFKNDVIWFVDNFTTLPKDYKTIIRNEQLKGPLRVESNLRVEKAGFVYLLESSDSKVFGQLAKVCGSKHQADWMSDELRISMLKKAQSGAEKCVKNMGQKFINFRGDYLSNYRQPSLVKFKSFITEYYKQADNVLDLAELFGPDNTFINGKLQAVTSMGSQFNLPFSSGQFRGLGVIDNFKRETGPRAPASILSE